jgi:hypothetical protein
MSQGHKYAAPPGRGASVEAAGAVRSMCHALRIHPLGACPLSTDRNHSTPKSHGTMHEKYCCKLQHETSAAAGIARLPRRTRPRPGRGTSSSPWRPTSTTSRDTRSAGTSRITGRSSGGSSSRQRPSAPRSSTSSDQNAPSAHLADHRRAAAVHPAQRPASGAEPVEADPAPRGVRCPA